MSEAEKYEADTARMIAADKAKWAAIRDTAHTEAMFEDRARSAATDWMYVSPMGDPVATLAIEVTAAHAEALLDDLACEVCGRREMHGNHRGIGHTHTPAEDPRGRAWAILGRIGAGLTVPAHVAETARMMLDPQNADMDVVAMDRIAAEADDGIRSALADQPPWTPVRELGHPAHPHLLDPGKCTHCSRPIFVRYDAHGGFESASHYA